MDALTADAAKALAAGNPLAALKRVALRDDAPALALRGIAMAQLGDYGRATELLRRAARQFGTQQFLARARCLLAEAEIALIARDLHRSGQALSAARALLAGHGDRVNAAHAAYLEARRLLLIGHLDAAETMLAQLDASVLASASRTGFELVTAGVAMRRIRAKPARAAIDRARRAALATGNPGLLAEVESAAHTLEAPVARLFGRGAESMIRLSECEDLFAKGGVVVDACRRVVHRRTATVALANRPVLFKLALALAQAWPDDAARADLLAQAFRARHVDESHRVRLRVEIGRLRKALAPIGQIVATPRGFRLMPDDGCSVAVLLPPVADRHAGVLALLADGMAWPSSALALALGVGTRTVQRALQELADTGKIERLGRGRACRWITPSVPGFPTSLLLPAALIAR